MNPSPARPSARSRARPSKASQAPQVLRELSGHEALLLDKVLEVLLQVLDFRGVSQKLQAGTLAKPAV